MNEKISQNPRRQLVLHIVHAVSSLVMVFRRSFAAIKANLLAIEIALLTRKRRSADHKVCHVMWAWPCTQSR